MTAGTPDLIAVLTTVDSLQQAQAIATALVERKLAACVQISKIESVYAWQGAIQNDEEFRVLAKTVKARYRDVEAAILELHTYDLPAVCALDIGHFDEKFAAWVGDNSAGNVSG